jgi:phytoene dehydrogenase-like protein
MRRETVVLGAGLSGLAAGVRLAQHGADVLLLERHSLWGGLNSFYKFAGRRIDVGLHALTNYAPAGARGAALTKILRQLRLRHADLELGEQGFSEIRFPGLCLRFSNDFELLRAELRAHFPQEVDGFERLAALAREFEPREEQLAFASARERLGELLRERQLIDALLLPTCFYGSPRANDVDWPQFLILFRALFLEGFSRPRGGIRTLLELLRRRYLELGGELRLRCGVKRLLVDGGALRGLELDDGSTIECARVISSAGWVESMRLCGAQHERPADEVGRMSFLESVTILDRPPAELGLHATVTFYNGAARLAYEPPQDLIDTRCGVLSVPNHYAGCEPELEGQVRQTAIAHPSAWSALPEHEYQQHKARCADEARAAIGWFQPSWGPHASVRDVFTPRTIERFTGHLNGAVYGSPRKTASGLTPVRGLVLCGTDQGYLGVIGAMMSGIAMANRHVLMPELAQAQRVDAEIAP